MNFTIVAFTFMTVWASVDCLSNGNFRRERTAITTSGSTPNRAEFLSTLTSGTAAVSVLFPLLVGPQSAVAAKEVDPALKGTKKDPAYEACLSQCIYECTKPKGAEQKSRAECIPECKKTCATTKQQLMVGTPINSS